MKYIVMANTQDSSQDTEQGPWRRLCLAALLIYIVDFYQPHHCAAMSLSMLSLSLSLPSHHSPTFSSLRYLSTLAPHPTCRLISNTCNECLNCHYHLLARVMFFGCHVSKYCEKISSPTFPSLPPSRTSQRQRFTRGCRPRGSFVPHDTKM